MKLKEYLYMLGLKPRERRYGYTIETFDLPKHGPVKYAKWKHPRTKAREVEESTVDELESFLERGDFCIDIGAHEGDTTVPMALAVGKEGAVLALEPNPYVFGVLTKNSTLNPSSTRIFPLMLAAGPSDGDLVFEYSDPGFCNGGNHDQISPWKHGHAFQLDVVGVSVVDLLNSRYGEFLPKLKYIKIDAEGFDLEVVKSLKPIIDSYRPFLLVEVFKHTSSSYRDDLYHFFKDREYTLYRADSHKNLRGTALNDRTCMQKWKHFDIFCVPTNCTERD